jgi:ADP-ribose pyrophosphatase YjhB (NUDIX family)
MKHRIRAAAVVEKNGKLLLVEHQDDRGNRWWIPPGGGLEDEDESILDCVRREVYEETGHHVQVGKLLYIREFIDRSNDTRHLELFYGAQLIGDGEGEFPVSAPTLFDHMILSVGWLGKNEMKGIAVFPDILKDGYWDFKDTEPIYLGVSIESDDRQS